MLISIGATWEFIILLSVLERENCIVVSQKLKV